LIVVNSPYG